MGTAPPRATTGSPSVFAVARPVTRLEQPGPDVTSTTPALPVMRPIPPAMNAAFCSCRQTTVLILESTSVSNTLSIFAPGTPKMYSTPCASRLLTSKPAPVCGRGLVTGVLTVFLLPPARDPRPGHDGGLLSRNPPFQGARCGNRLRAGSGGEDSSRGIGANGRPGCGRPTGNGGDSRVR